MGFLTSLFGGESNYLTMVIGLAIVLVLIVIAVWLLKLLSEATRTVGRGRNRRLAVIDSVAIDQKRQAIIIRRDGVEHLIVTGGPNDLVVESGFEAPPQVATVRQRKQGVVAEPGQDQQPTPKSARAEPVTPGTMAKSLRHTGLLRSGDEPEVELGGGKPDNRDSRSPDSGTTGSGAGQEPVLETVVDAGNSDYAEAAKIKRR